MIVGHLWGISTYIYSYCVHTSTPEMLLSNVHIVYDLIHLHYQSAGTYVDKLSAIHGYHLAAVCVCVLCVCLCVHMQNYNVNACTHTRTVYIY